MNEQRQITPQPTPWDDETVGPIATLPRPRRVLWFAIPAALLVLILFGAATGLLVKWLWMRELDFSGIFWTLLAIKWAMFGSAFVFAFVYLWLNAHWAVKSATAPDDAWMVTSLAGLVSAGVAVFAALAFSSQ